MREKSIGKTSERRSLPVILRAPQPWRKPRAEKRGFEENRQSGAHRDESDKKHQKDTLSGMFSLVNGME